MSKKTSTPRLVLASTVRWSDTHTEDGRRRREGRRPERRTGTRRAAVAAAVREG